MVLLLGISLKTVVTANAKDIASYVTLLSIYSIVGNNQSVQGICRMSKLELPFIHPFE